MAERPPVGGVGGRPAGTVAIVSLPRNGEIQRMGGFDRVIEQVLKALSPDPLVTLNQSQGLALAYAQLIFTGHLAELSKRAEKICQLTSAEAPANLD